MTRLLIVALALGAPAVALAHGPRPAAQAVVFDEADPSFAYVASNVYGHFVSHDGGESFAWICSDVFSSGAFGTFSINGVVLAGSTQRTLLVAGSKGLVRSTDDGCTWQLIDAFGGRRNSSLALDPDNPDRVLLTTDHSGGRTSNALYESLDAGVTFSATTLQGPHLYRSVTFGVGDHLWAVSFAPAEDASYLHHSDDDGLSWTATLLPQLPARSYRIAGIVPNAPQTVLLRAGTVLDDVLILAEEAGAESTVVLEPNAALFETRVADDGMIVVGDGGGRTWQSADGRSWDERSDKPGQQCFVDRGDALYACARQLEDQSGINVSRDDGVTWEPFFRYEYTTAPLSCLGPTEALQCTGGDRFVAQCFEFDEFGVDIAKIDACPELPTFGDDDAAATDDSGDADGDSGPAADLESTGCACRGRHERPGPPVALALWVLWATRRRRR